MADTRSRELERHVATGDTEAGKALARDQCRQGNHYWSDWTPRGIPRKGVDRDVTVWNPYRIAEKLGFSEIREAYLGSRSCFFCAYEQRRITVRHHYVGWDDLMRKHVMSEDVVVFG